MAASSSTSASGSALRSALRLHFVGTGTSTALPVAPCLAEVDKPSRDVGTFLEEYTAAEDKAPAQWAGYDPSAAWPASVACSSCRAAVDRRVSDGWKNRRGNPGLVLRKQNADGVWRNVVVDVGKTFREQSCKLFPRWGIKRIDAVLITHGHADAYNGLDDLREWCNRQGSGIPVYLSQATFDTVAASFPYLVDKTKATGGHDLPTLEFKVIDDETEFEVEGITVTTLPVHHGRYFNSTPAVAPAPSAPGTPAPEAPAPGAPTPFICLGYVFDRSVVLLSDVSSVPDQTWKRLDAALGGEQLPVLIVDALWPWRPHASHVSWIQAMEIALRIKASITYVLGMTHPTTHWQWEELGRSIRGEDGKEPEHDTNRLTQQLVKEVWAHDTMYKIADGLREWKGVVEPAYDGLGLEVEHGQYRVLAEGQGSTGGWDL
ncbi:hypothetical protein Q8F55_004246 [Vanrija albida]|uniref:Metallo-beta-lactamase domain-containing protein n=1 Tax=Vanrija albida TaxID=181172 RepID=A0ABR3Q6H6_9TREE